MFKVKIIRSEFRLSFVYCARNDNLFDEYDLRPSES